MMAGSRITFAGLEPYRLTGVTVTDRKLGCGAYATVLELEYLGIKCAGKKIHEVLLQQGDADYIVQRFEEECHLLSQVRHSNIVQFLGVHFKQGERAPILVMEFLPTNLTSCIDQYGILPKEVSYSILHDVALGLCYLHSRTPPIIHRNLSSNNVLLTHNMTAKISDPGVARILNLSSMQASQMTRIPGTPAYMPPEVMVAEPKYDTTTDVFSYGILMIHILSGKWPEPQVGPSRLNGSGKIIPVTEAQRRDVYLKAIGNDHPLMDLIRKCIGNIAKERPHSRDIVKQLANTVSQYPRTSFHSRMEQMQAIEFQQIRMQIRDENSKIQQVRHEKKAKLVELNAEIATLDNTILLLKEKEAELEANTTALQEKSAIITETKKLFGRVKDLPSAQQQGTSIDRLIKDNTVCAGQSTFFFEAANKYKVPFLYHDLIECDCKGREYTIEDHDITLRIPEGALAEGQKVHFEIGIAMYGPFIFPANTRQISPIVWLCILEEDAEQLLQEPFQLILPHFLTGLKRDELHHHQIEFSKASHTNKLEKNKSTYFVFNRGEVKPLLAAIGYSSYGIIKARHCCFYCLKAKVTPGLAMDAGYCLTRFERLLPPRRIEITFAATFLLKTCIEDLQKQFPREQGYKIPLHNCFKFNSDVPAKLCIQVVPGAQDQYVAAFEPAAAEILVSEIEFWDLGLESMELRQELRIYPPRVKLTIGLRGEDIIKVHTTFVGCSADNHLDFELALPTDLSRSAPTGLPQHSHRIVTDSKPKLIDALRETFSLAPQWKIFGTFLGVKDTDIDRIQSDEGGVNDRLRSMLVTWLKQVQPQPNWRHLIEAVKIVNNQLADDIQEHIATD